MYRVSRCFSWLNTSLSAYTCFAHNEDEAEETFRPKAGRVIVEAIPTEDDWTALAFYIQGWNVGSEEDFRLAYEAGLIKCYRQVRR